MVSWPLGLIGRLKQRQALSIGFNMYIVFLAVSLCLSVTSVVNASPGAVTALAFSPDGSRLAVGAYGQVVLYDTTTWAVAGTFRQVEDSVRALAFQPDGQVLAIGSGLPAQSGRVTLWDISGTKSPTTLPTQQDTVEAICFRSDGKALLVGANDNKARFYAELPAQTNSVLDEHNGRVQAVAFSPKPDTIFITGAMDKVVKVWDAKQKKTVINFDQSQAGITGLVFLPGGNQFVGSSLDGKLQWWQVNYNDRTRSYNGNRFRQIDVHPGGVLSLAISGDGKRIVTGGQDNVVSVRDSSSGREIRSFKDSMKPVYAVTLNLDGKLAAGAGMEGVVRIWDVEKNELLQTLTLPPLPVSPRLASPAVKPIAATAKSKHRR